MTEMKSFPAFPRRRGKLLMLQTSGLRSVVVIEDRLDSAGNINMRRKIKLVLLKMFALALVQT